MTEIYASLGTKGADQKILNLDALGKRNYLKVEVWVMKKLGLEKLFGIQQDYNVEAIQQFYATVVFDEDEDISLTWMTGAVKCESSIKRLAELLDYEFKGDTEPVGKRMHQEGVAYDKRRLAPMYEK